MRLRERLIEAESAIRRLTAIAARPQAAINAGRPYTINNCYGADLASAQVLRCRSRSG
jgi:hypothetical protein